MKRNSILNDFGEDEEDIQPCKKKLKNIEETSSESDSSDDDDAEICAICLGKLYKSQVGSPEGCDHVFCLKCILEWSKNVNTCPVDRMPFQIIFARESVDDNSAVIINVESKDKRAVDENDVTVCEICNLGDREDRLLLCDGCNKGYHLECLTPPLVQVPVGDWYCEDCEVNSPGPSHARSNRMIPRTLIYQRVMRNIGQRLESSDEDDSEEDEDANDSEDDSEDEEAADAKHDEHPIVPLNVLRRAKQSTTRSKRKKKCSPLKSRSKKRKGSRKKRRKSRRKAKRSLPSMFGESSKSKSQKYPFEQNSLSIYGNRLPLHSFKDDIPICSTSKSDDSNTASAPKVKDDKKSFDILGDILNGQALLHSKSSDVVIGRDGRLKPLKPLPDMRLQEGKQLSSSFFLRDICTSSSSCSSIASPSLSCTSSPRSSPSFHDGRYNGSLYSQYSDFSDSSNDSHPGQVQPGPSYEESYKSLTKDARNKTKSKNEANLQKGLMMDKKYLFDKPGEYSPICDDDCDDINSGSGNEANTLRQQKTSVKVEVQTLVVTDDSERGKILKQSPVAKDLSKCGFSQLSNITQAGSSNIQADVTEIKTLRQESAVKSEEKRLFSNSSKCTLIDICGSSSKSSSSDGSKQTEKVLNDLSKCSFSHLTTITQTSSNNDTQADITKVKNYHQELALKTLEKKSFANSNSSKCIVIDVCSSSNESNSSVGISRQESLEVSIKKEMPCEERPRPNGKAEDEEEDDDSKMDVEFDSVSMHDKMIAANKEGKSRLAANSNSASTMEDKVKKLAFVEKLMQEALRTYYVNRQINKDDYKHIMKKGVSKIMKSRDKSVEPQKVKKFVDQYVLSVHMKKLP